MEVASSTGENARHCPPSGRDPPDASEECEIFLTKSGDESAARLSGLLDRPLSLHESRVAGACSIGQDLADLLPPLQCPALTGGSGDSRNAFLSGFLELQRRFYSSAIRLRSKTEGGSDAAPLLFKPDPEKCDSKKLQSACPLEGEGEGEDEMPLTVDRAIAALLEGGGSLAERKSTSVSKENKSEAETMTEEEVSLQLRLQLAAARYVAQGRPPPPALLHSIASCLPPDLYADLLTRPSVLKQLVRQLKAHSRQNVLSQLEDRRRLVDCILSNDASTARNFHEICELPEGLKRRAMLERRLSSLSAFQQRLRRSVLLQGRRQSLPLAEVLLTPEIPGSVGEEPESCGCVCFNCCHSRVSSGGASLSSSSSALLAGQASSLIGEASAEGLADALKSSCCGCCCEAQCDWFVVCGAKDKQLPKQQPPRTSLSVRAALEAALDPLSLADVDCPAVCSKAQRVRALGASAVRAVFSKPQRRARLLPPWKTRQQQRKLLWTEALRRRWVALNVQWRAGKELLAKAAKAAASQVAVMEQKKQLIREKEQKERMRLLKENDMDAYMQLVKQTKNQRLQELLSATDEFLESLGRRVEVQKTSTQETLKRRGAEMYKSAASEEEAEDRSARPSGRGFKSLDKYYALSHAVQEQVKQPSTLVGGSLMPYQMAGLAWLVSLHNNNLHGILADEMGLGKTIQTIALLAYLKEVKNNRGPHLIIVPLSTLSNWAEEFERWAPSLKVLLFKGGRQERRLLQRQLREADFEVCITTFDLAIREKNALAVPQWRHLVVDEGHRMKNSKSKFHLCVSALAATHRLLLTGTPLQNNLTELWSLLNFLLPKIFSSAEDFEKWFCQPFEVHGLEGAADGSGGAGGFLNEEEQLLVINRLHAVLRPFLLRRVKKDVLQDMPEKKEFLVRIPLTAWQRLLYENLQGKGLGAAREIFSKRSLHNTLMQLRKTVNHPYLFVDEYTVDEMLVKASGKFECLDRMLPKLLHFKHKTLIFSQMTQVLDLMADYLDLRGIKYERLDGSVGLQERKERIDLFNRAGEDAMVFMLSTRAGGLGLNLQAADTVILFDSDFNPHQDLQAMCRAHRVGQTKQVRVFRLVTISGVEEVILQRANKKLSIDQKVIQAGMFDNKSSEDLREEKLRFLLLLSKSDGMDAKATTPKQLNRILSRSEEELAWFDAYDRRVLGADDEELTLKADNGGTEAAEAEALYEPPIDEQDEDTREDADPSQGGNAAEPTPETETEREVNQEVPREETGEAIVAKVEDSDVSASASLNRKSKPIITNISSRGEQASVECEEEVKALLERHGRIVKNSELPDWLTAAAAAVEAEAVADEEANNVETDAEADGSVGSSWIAKNRKRRNISRPNYCDALSESKYVKLVEKFESGELDSEELQTALAREAEKAHTRKKFRGEDKVLQTKKKRSLRSKSRQRDSPREEVASQGFEEDSPPEAGTDSPESADA